MRSLTRMMPASFREGSSSVTRVRPTGRQSGESIDTRSGSAASTAARIASSLPSTLVSASHPLIRQNPEGRSADPVRSRPTTFAASAAVPPNRSVKWTTLRRCVGGDGRGASTLAMPRRLIGATHRLWSGSDRRKRSAVVLSRITWSRMKPIACTSARLYSMSCRNAVRSPRMYRCHRITAVAPSTSSSPLRQSICRCFSISFCPPTSPIDRQV